MNPFKYGDLLVVKITGEPVFVLSVATEINNRRTVVTVRRANQTQNGLSYAADDFYAEELETLEQRAEREAQFTSHLMNLRDGFKSAREASPVLN